MNGSNPEEKPFGSSSESSRSSRRQVRCAREVHNDFKVDIPKFKGKLDQDELLDWLQTVERVFDFKEIPDEKKVKLIALSLESMPLLGGLMYFLKRLRRVRVRLNH